MSSVIFSDEFKVEQVNPEGKKFEKVDRLLCKGVVYELEFLVDINCELFDVDDGNKLSVAIATSLSLDGTDTSDFLQLDGKPSLLVLGGGGGQPLCVGTAAARAVRGEARRADLGAGGRHVHAVDDVHVVAASAQ